VTDNNGFILALLSIAMGLFARSPSVRHGGGGQQMHYPSIDTTVVIYSSRIAS
jgi:hypothetical protein